MIFSSTRVSNLFQNSSESVSLCIYDRFGSRFFLLINHISSFSHQWKLFQLNDSTNCNMERPGRSADATFIGIRLCFDRFLSDIVHCLFMLILHSVLTRVRPRCHNTRLIEHRVQKAKETDIFVSAPVDLMTDPQIYAFVVLGRSYLLS